jgi:hypothetical protein
MFSSCPLRNSVSPAPNFSAYLRDLGDQKDHASRPAWAKSVQDPISKLTRTKQTGNVAQECLLCECEALSLNLSPRKKKRGKIKFH